MDLNLRPYATRLIGEYLAYDPETGLITWLKTLRNGTQIGSIAGSRGRDGYVRINLLGVSFKAHRVAWLLHYGTMPGEGFDIDHRNGITSDNRISNLRLATRSQNNQNQCAQKRKAGGLKGAYFHKASKRWHARIRVSGKTISLGYFETEVAASCAYDAAAVHLFGEFSRCNHVSAAE